MKKVVRPRPAKITVGFLGNLSIYKRLIIQENKYIRR